VPLVASAIDRRKNSRIKLKIFKSSRNNIYDNVDQAYNRSRIGDQVRRALTPKSEKIVMMFSGTSIS